MKYYACYASNDSDSIFPKFHNDGIYHNHIKNLKINNNNKYLPYIQKNMKENDADSKYFFTNLNQLNTIDNNIFNIIRVRLQNDSINLLHMFYNKNNLKFKSNQIVYFSQIGIQNLLSENHVINFGIGKRHLCNNRSIIGYNTTINIPIFSQMCQPYSMNIGGEYWYKNLIFSLSSYLNLDKITNFKTSIYHPLILYPQIGYQTQFKIKLPYISECHSQIKWEHFFYDKSNDNLFNQSHESQCALSIGVQYKPIPILEFNIDNVFMHKKYTNTVFKIALNYQFNNVSINQQSHQKYFYNTKSLSLNKLSTMIEPFTPDFYFRYIHSVFTNTEITGYAGELKFIQINDNHASLIQNHPKLFFNTHHAQIAHIKNNTYAIYLPKHDFPKKEETGFSYSNKNENSKQAIPILTKTLTMQENKNENFYLKKYNEDDETSSSYSNEDVNNITNNTELTNLEKSHDLSINDTEIKFDTNNSNTSLNDTDTLYEKNNSPTTLLNSSNNNSCSNYPVPPKLPDFTYSPIPSSSSVNTQQQQPTCSKAWTTSDIVASHDVIQTNDSKNNFAINSKNDPDVSLNRPDDFFHQLHLQKNTKFSSTNTQEYIEKLENSILARKKAKQLTDIEKMFNKMHITLSQSSIANSSETSDSIDSFSE